MPVTTRKRKLTNPVKPNYASDDDDCDPESLPPASTHIRYKDDDPFEKIFNSPNKYIEVSEGEASDYKSRKKHKTTKSKAKSKTNKFKQLNHGPPPVAPDMSDNEDTSMIDELDDWWNVEQRHRISDEKSNSAAPQILRIEVNGSPGQPTTLNLNIAELLQLQDSKSFPAQGSLGSLLNQNYDVGGSKDKRSQAKAKTGFLDLPYEIRVRVYRQVFVTDTPIVFHQRSDFCRSGGFLRTCKKVATEGTEVLYGENAFHFERSNEKRGTYFEAVWKELGYRDIRRFLMDVGSTNISRIKHVSFVFEDAPLANKYSARVDPDTGKFVHDPVLQCVLNILSTNTVLLRFAVTFAGRVPVKMQDYHFLKALTSIKCRQLIQVSGNPKSNSQAGPEMFGKMKKVMVVPRDEDDEVDQSKNKKVVKLFHEHSPWNRYGRY